MATSYTILTYDHDEQGDMLRFVGQQTAASPAGALRAHFAANEKENGDEFVIVPTGNLHRVNAQVETRRQLTITTEGT
jgi:hypothetical protein